MPERYIRVALHDGNGNQTVTPGVSKWVIGTILEFYPASFTQGDFRWGDISGFLILRAQRDNITPTIVQNIRDRKYKISVPKLKAQFGWTNTQIQNYLNNYLNFAKKFREDEVTYGYRYARKKWKALFEASGIQPPWTKVLDLDEVDIIEATPEWQWVVDEAMEGL